MNDWVDRALRNINLSAEIDPHLMTSTVSYFLSFMSTSIHHSISEVWLCVGDISLLVIHVINVIPRLDQRMDPITLHYWRQSQAPERKTCFHSCHIEPAVGEQRSFA